MVARIEQTFQLRTRLFESYAADRGNLPPVELEEVERNMRILQEAKDPETAVILIDVELGYGSNADPPGQLVPVIRKSKDLAKEAGRHLPVVALLIGTEGDFQGLARQERALADVRVLIMPSNAQATRLSALISSGRGIGVTIFGRAH